MPFKIEEKFKFYSINGWILIESGDLFKIQNAQYCLRNLLQLIKYSNFDLLFINFKDLDFDQGNKLNLSAL